MRPRTWLGNNHRRRRSKWIRISRETPLFNRRVEVRLRRGIYAQATLRALLQFCHKMTGRADPLCPSTSNVNLLRYGKGVVYLDTETPHRAFDLPMSQ